MITSQHFVPNEGFPLQPSPPTGGMEAQGGQKRTYVALEGALEDQLFSHGVEWFGGRMTVVVERHGESCDGVRRLGASAG